MSSKISIISVNFNGFDLTCALLDSIRKNVSTPLEVIVVDNGSKRDEAALLRERYPEIKAVRSEENLGFAGGNNIGIKEATGEYLFFLNNDTEIEKDGFSALTDTFEKYPEAGVVCPKIRFFHGSRPIQFAGYTPMHGIAMKNDLVGFMHEDDGSFDTPSESPFAHGAAMCVRRAALEDIGPWPECFFLYFEELDWSLQFIRKGWKIRYAPYFTIFHKESATTGQDSPLRCYYMTRSRQMFAYRNYSGIMRTLTILYSRYLSGGKKIITSALHGRWDLVKAVFKGTRDFRRLKRQGLC